MGATPTQLGLYAVFMLIGTAVGFLLALGLAEATGAIHHDQPRASR